MLYTMQHAIGLQACNSLTVYNWSPAEAVDIATAARKPCCMFLDTLLTTECREPQTLIAILDMQGMSTHEHWECH